jgi:hypothetical protein
MINQPLEAFTIDALVFVKWGNEGNSGAFECVHEEDLG